jgi:UDP-N-acetylmuramoyl-tripeptide--D-alanyl-D-alanine ligase
MMAALRTQLDRGTSGKNVAVIGEMLELGDESVQKHEELLQVLKNFDRVFLVGDVFSTLITEHDKKSFSVCSKADKNLARDIRNETNKGDTILVKGSNKIFWSHNFVAELCKRLEV